MGEFFLKWAFGTVFMFVAMPLFIVMLLVGAAFVMWDASAISYGIEQMGSWTAARIWLVVSALFGLVVACDD